jgi:hypothetical protein
MAAIAGQNREEEGSSSSSSRLYQTRLYEIRLVDALSHDHSIALHQDVDLILLDSHHSAPSHLVCPQW